MEWLNAHVTLWMGFFCCELEALRKSEFKLFRVELGPWDGRQGNFVALTHALFVWLNYLHMLVIKAWVSFYKFKVQRFIVWAFLKPQEFDFIEKWTKDFSYFFVFLNFRYFNFSEHVLESIELFVLEDLDILLWIELLWFWYLSSWKRSFIK
jgi:hypothetical protein